MLSATLLWPLYKILKIPDIARPALREISG